MLPMASKREQQGLPDELWEKILESVDDNSVTAFASACKQLRRVQQASRRKLKTEMSAYSNLSFIGIGTEFERIRWVSEDWCLWSETFLASTKEEKKRKHIINAQFVTAVIYQNIYIQINL